MDTKIQYSFAGEKALCRMFAKPACLVCQGWRRCERRQLSLAMIWTSRFVFWKLRLINLLENNNPKVPSLPKSIIDLLESQDVVSSRTKTYQRLIHLCSYRQIWQHLWGNAEGGDWSCAEDLLVPVTSKWEPSPPTSLVRRSSTSYSLAKRVEKDENSPGRWGNEPKSALFLCNKPPGTLFLRNMVSVDRWENWEAACTGLRTCYSKTGIAWPCVYHCHLWFNPIWSSSGMRHICWDCDFRCRAWLLVSLSRCSEWQLVNLAGQRAFLRTPPRIRVTPYPTCTEHIHQLGRIAPHLIRGSFPHPSNTSKKAWAGRDGATGRFNSPNARSL